MAQEIADAVKTGDEKAILTATRDRIAEALDDPDISGRDLAALSRRLLEITKELRAIEEEKKEGGVVEQVEDEPFDPSTA